MFGDEENPHTSIDEIPIEEVYRSDSEDDCEEGNGPDDDDNTEFDYETIQSSLMNVITLRMQQLQAHPYLASRLAMFDNHLALMVPNTVQQNQVTRTTEITENSLRISETVTNTTVTTYKTGGLFTICPAINGVLPFISNASRENPFNAQRTLAIMNGAHDKVLRNSPKSKTKLNFVNAGDTDADGEDNEPTDDQILPLISMDKKLIKRRSTVDTRLSEPARSSIARNRKISLDGTPQKKELVRMSVPLLAKNLKPKSTIDVIPAEATADVEIIQRSPPSKPVQPTEPLETVLNKPINESKEKNDSSLELVQRSPTAVYSLRSNTNITDHSSSPLDDSGDNPLSKLPMSLKKNAKNLIESSDGSATGHSSASNTSGKEVPVPKAKYKRLKSEQLNKIELQECFVYLTNVNLEIENKENQMNTDRACANDDNISSNNICDASDKNRTFTVNSPPVLDRLCTKLIKAPTSPIKDHKQTIPDGQKSSCKNNRSKPPTIKSSKIISPQTKPPKAPKPQKTPKTPQRLSLRNRAKHLTPAMQQPPRTPNNPIELTTPNTVKTKLSSEILISSPLKIIGKTGKWPLTPQILKDSLIQANRPDEAEKIKDTNLSGIVIDPKKKLYFLPDITPSRKRRANDSNDNDFLMLRMKRSYFAQEI